MQLSAHCRITVSYAVYGLKFWLIEFLQLLQNGAYQLLKRFGKTPP